MIAFLLALAAPQISPRDLGKAEGACRSPEPGAAFVVDVEGLRDRAGLLKLEVYPPDDSGFLADDTYLVGKGLVFRRVETAIPQSGTVRLCVRLPGAGRYAVSLLHDRNADHRFNLSEDGIGFANDPKLGWGKPKAAAVPATANAAPTPLRITMNYRHGLSMRPDRR